MAWMDRAMVSLPAGETTAVAFDGLTVTAPPQAEPAAPGPRPAFVPTVTDAAKALWTDGQIDQAKTALPSFLERLEFDGVRRARDGDGDPKWSATFETKSATVALKGREESDGVWFSLSALPRPGFVPSEPPKYPGDPHVPDWTKLDQRFAGWEFKMPSWKADSLRRLRAKEAPAAGADPDSAPTGLPGLTPAR
jgi:hypothetical protein